MIPPVTITEALNRIDMNSTRVADEFEFSGLTSISANEVNAPVIAEAPIQVECHVFDTIEVSPHREGCQPVSSQTLNSWFRN